MNRARQVDVGRCVRCGRPLSDPLSRQLGAGPVCRAQGAGRVPDLFGGVRPALNEPRASYDMVRITPEVVWIRDRDEDGARSVTNDAERVVRELLERFAPETPRIIYRDSMGRWDELKHDGARFTGFAPAPDMAPRQHGGLT